MDPDDRRKLTIALTERGRAAAAVQAAAREQIDNELSARVGEEDVTYASHSGGVDSHWPRAGRGAE